MIRYKASAHVGLGDPWRNSVTFTEFRQVVRRYRPSELLPALARLAAQNPYDRVDLDLARTIAPWGIALIARESTLWGNEHRHAPVDQEALRRVFNAYNDLHEDEGERGDVSLLSLITPIVYDQFPYQESIYEEVCRTHALLVEGLPHVNTRVVTEQTWIDILGRPLDEMVAATFVLQVGANENNGWFNPGWLDQPNFAEVLKRWPRDLILARLDQLTFTREEFKDAYEAAPKPTDGRKRYTFNPLTARPFLRMPDGRRLAPQPRLILRTISPGSLYYTGIAHLHPKQFGGDLGLLTEHYVGRQLQTIEAVQLHPEIKYGNPEKKSIDWFLVLPNVVVMFEVKSTRFGLLQRAAEGHEDAITNVIGGALKQLIRSDSAIANNNPAFAHIPTDRPRIGIVVTAEPYYLANSNPARDLTDDPPFPTLVASLRDIEMLVTLTPDELEQHLTAIANDPERSTWQLGIALKGVKRGHRNPVLQHAWDTYFRDAFAGQEAWSSATRWR